MRHLRPLHEQPLLRSASSCLTSIQLLTRSLSFLPAFAALADRTLQFMWANHLFSPSLEVQTT